MAKQYTWTNADGLTLGGGRNSPDSDRGEVSTKVDLTETEVASVQALVSVDGIQPRYLDGALRVDTAGRLLRGNAPFAHKGVNAFDLFTEMLKGGTAYTTQLPTIAGFCNTIRVSATMATYGDLVASWATYIGTNGKAPVATYLTSLKTFLDECSKNRVGVVLSLLWRASVDLEWVIPGATKLDWLTQGSTLRTYMRDLTRTIVRKFADHPAIVGWELGNEWDYDAETGQLLTGRAFAATSITSVANNGSGLFRVTSVDHRIGTGQPVTIAGVGGSTGINTTWASVTRITKDTFDLVGSTFAGVYTSGGTVTNTQAVVPRRSTVTATANNGSSLVRITTSAAHQLVTGMSVNLYDVGGTVEANGTWTVTRISSTTFDLVGSTFSNAWTSGGTVEADRDTAYLAVVNELVAIIRQYDTERMILSPQGNATWTYDADSENYARRRVQLAGDCDAVSVHYYPDQWVSVGGAVSPRNTGVGDTLAGGPVMLKALKAEAARRGKAVVMGECNGEFDNPSGTFSATSFNHADSAGIELAFDWTWQAAAGANNANLRVERVSNQAIIASANGSRTTPTTIVQAELPAFGAFRTPTRCLRTTGLTNSHAFVAGNADLEPISNAPIIFMGWIKREATVASARRLIADGTNTSGWMFLEGLNADTIDFQIYTTLAMQVNMGVFPIGKWEPFLVYCDMANVGGFTTTHIFRRGVYQSRTAYAYGAYTPSVPNLMYFGAASDGNNPNAVSVMDFIIGKNAVPTVAEFLAYVKTGAIPSWAQHRWKFDGNGLDSIGSLNATVNAAAGYASSGIGSGA